MCTRWNVSQEEYHKPISFRLRRGGGASQALVLLALKGPRTTRLRVGSLPAWLSGNALG